MKKIILIIFASLAFIIITLHSQTIPFILMVIIGIVTWMILARQQKKLKAVTHQNEIASIQLKAVSSAPNSEILYTALAGIQTQIINNEITKKSNKLSQRLALTALNETRYVNHNDILRCEADNTYTKFILTSGEEILVSKTLKEYADILSDQAFIRTHQSHLININYIKSWLREDGGYLLLTDGAKIPVSKLNREKVKQALAG
ncbi:LytR/AlgR family response regulator transcription factor [Mucilaginibacter phyllosphaerae]